MAFCKLGFNATNMTENRSCPATFDENLECRTLRKLFDGVTDHTTNAMGDQLQALSTTY
jgi:hypothetical protein